MEKSFEDALGDLLLQYRDTPRDELISALECAIDVLEDERAEGEDG